MKGTGPPHDNHHYCYPTSVVNHAGRLFPGVKLVPQVLLSFRLLGKSSGNMSLCLLQAHLLRRRTTLARRLWCHLGLGLVGH